eukprot:1137470-Pelagomonas_calceolata.AAC.6
MDALVSDNTPCMNSGKGDRMARKRPTSLIHRTSKTEKASGLNIRKDSRHVECSVTALGPGCENGNCLPCTVAVAVEKRSFVQRSSSKKPLRRCGKGLQAGGAHQLSGLQACSANAPPSSLHAQQHHQK